MAPEKANPRRVNADSPWRDPSSTGPVEGGDLPEKQGWVPKGTRTQTGNQRQPNQGHPPPPDTTPHHPRFPGGAVEGGGGPRKGWRAWGGRFPASHLQFPGRGGCRWWTWGGKQATPRPRCLERSHNTLGHPTGHAHVDSRKDGGGNARTLAQVQAKPPTPPSSPHHGEEGWEASSTGGTGRARSLGFGPGCRWGCQHPYEPGPPTNDRGRAGIAPPPTNQVIGGVFGSLPPPPSRPTPSKPP